MSGKWEYMYLHGLWGLRPLKQQSTATMAVWLQAKVREFGLGCGLD